MDGVKAFRGVVRIVPFALGLMGCAAGEGTAQRGQDGSCTKADQIEYVSGGSECLAIKTYAPSNLDSDTVLIVSLHGDKSNGRPISHEYDTPEKLADSKTISVAMLRPGYDDKFGKRSSGHSYGRRDNYTAHNVDAIAEAIRNLKKHHKASKVVLAGYSGGANISGVILGRHPDVADGAVLLACNCDIPRWRAAMSSWQNSLSAHEFVGGIPATTRIIAVTGDRDTNTDVSLAKSYVTRLKERGIPSEFRVAVGVNHDTGLSSPEYMNAVKDMVALVRSAK
ncbi:MAG: prolyl oligopeptidase family serine peptidase [Magnetospirillum sp.]|nr:prolyl oligopeptidase family serine peptidase [Magnetospirillum sp.]